MNPRVKAVLPQDNYTLELTFTNGEVGIFDCSKLLAFGVFKELADIDYFRKASVQYGTVAWPNEQDVCPDTLYEDSVKARAGSLDSLGSTCSMAECWDEQIERDEQAGRLDAVIDRALEEHRSGRTRRLYPPYSPSICRATRAIA